MVADASDYLPPQDDTNKARRVTIGLGWLRHGQGDGYWHPLSPDPAALSRVVPLLVEALPVVGDPLRKSLARDGFRIEASGEVVAATGADGPADRVGAYVSDLFGANRALDTASRHYTQATQAFDGQAWESANAQFRSAVEATFEALAHAKGCPASKTRGEARGWLQREGHLGEDEGKLVQAFMNFASANGSHTGISDAVEAGLRRHFASSLIAFATAKLG